VSFARHKEPGLRVGRANTACSLNLFAHSILRQNDEQLAFVIWSAEKRELSIEPVAQAPGLLGIVVIAKRHIWLERIFRKIGFPARSVTLPGRWDDVRGQLVFEIPET
jgi:hypothetical protein